MALLVVLLSFVLVHIFVVEWHCITHCVHGIHGNENSTKDPGQEPFAFQVGLGQVIKGWDEGVLGMKLGEKARLTCSPDYAYGARGFPAWGYPSFSVHCPLLRILLHVSLSLSLDACVLVRERMKRFP